MSTNQERFEAKFIKGNGNECWDWMAYKIARGYGQFRFSGRLQLAHRVAYQIYIGEIPNGLCVLHRCDNRRCVNPAHLFLGTNADNTHDCMSKGRAAHGERNGQSKLTSRKAKIIRVLRSNGAQLKDLSKLFKVSTTTIFNVVHNVSWTNV